MDRVQREGYYCRVELDLTSDGKRRVCCHPSVDVPYEHKKPIPGSDPVHNNEETHDQVQKKQTRRKRSQPCTVCSSMAANRCFVYLVLLII
ncbi:39S ribosomal protein L42, mitochondrial-like [Physeter macrocephalus]|uniref:Large ribosomal subunit protein mL42 n=1 Tax=Physeter macrocephalus TaxID=9755 RepID=A0A455BAQ4_PHYMC|nr:39S ribosomal protein L42, mitochondrial-like [Physeter catodon]XP_028346049.1 39S ribosomal protein L42, mitochondrial-like [Physeter catodon]XP_028346050.1 39S ribosomal protein L42, mitochondrial-like [Physeter catodon]|eukprot:XP_028346048.1 39S ribosomal protein L42, mitochondrial-like [Physeter catodon]